MNLHPQPQRAPVTVRQAIGHLASPGTDGRRHRQSLINAWNICPPGKSLRKTVRTVSSFQSVRLHPDRPSTTQTSAHFNWHYDSPRYLTTAEMALIGSFPDSFRWPQRRELCKRLLGNSVPPLFMRAIALSIRREILASGSSGRVA
jgi:site-specific DNA-cytosine methylase